MKKRLLFIAAALLIVGAVGCGGAKKVSPPQEQTAPVEAPKPQSKYPFPQNAAPTGTGKISVQTPSGDSATGTIPVLFVKKDDALVQIGDTLTGFDGSREVFIFINKAFHSAVQGGEMTQGNLDLTGDLLMPGDYTVSAIQFEGNDPKGKVTHYSEAKYTVKQGS